MSASLNEQDDELPPNLRALLDKGRAPKPAAGSKAATSGADPGRYYWLAVLGLTVLLGGMAVSQKWVPNKWLHGDGAFYMNVSRGLLENRSLRQESLHPHSWYDRELGWNRNVDAAWSNIALGRNGEWWPKHPILMPVLAAPFLWAFGAPGTLLFHFAFYALIGVFAFRIASRVASRPAALAAACAFAATPWIYERAWGFNNDVFYSVIVLAALDAAFGRRAVLAGALLGIGVFAKATNVLYGPALLLVFVLQKDWRGALRFCLAAAAPALLYLGLNWFMYGSPLKTGYDRILVRLDGQLSTHSVTGDFRWSNLGGGLKKVLLGGEGFLGKFPLFFPALAGLALLLLRRWRDGLVLAWCLAVPIVFHAPFAWYRLEFNLPQLALSVAPLAVLLPPFGRPREGDEEADAPKNRVHWGRLLGLLALVIFGGAGLLRHSFAGQRDYFWTGLPRAEVFLGEVPCDYFNNQMERWECTSFDTSDWHMTGRPLTPKLLFEGKKAELLLLHPPPSGKERRLEYPAVPMTAKLKVRYGLEDRSRADASVRFQVRVDGQPVFDEEVRGKGIVEKEIDTAAWAGQTARVALVSSAANADWALFAVDGGPEHQPD